MDRLAPRRGRPRKFVAPSRPVTVTLPESLESWRRFWEGRD